MKKQISTFAGIVIILVVAAIALGGVFLYQQYSRKNIVTPTQSPVKLGNYMKDANNVYIYVNPGYSKIEGADPASFVLVKDDNYPDVTDSTGKDKNHVYWEGKIVPDADPKSFVNVGDIYYKDELHVWFLDDPNGFVEILGANAPTFVYLNGSNAKDVYHTYSYSGGLVIDNGGQVIGNSKLYLDDSNSFSLSYPKTLSIANYGYGAWYPFVNPPVAFIAFDNSSIETEGYITINMSSDANDMTNCIQPGAIHDKISSLSFTSSSSVVVNNTSFAKSNFGNGDVNGLEQDYTTLRGNTCFDIQTTAFPDACVSSGCENRLWSSATETSLINQLDSIVQNFKFTK